MKIQSSAFVFSQKYLYIVYAWCEVSTNTHLIPKTDQINCSPAFMLGVMAINFDVLAVITDNSCMEKPGSLLIALLGSNLGIQATPLWGLPTHPS